MGQIWYFANRSFLKDVDQTGGKRKVFLVTIGFFLSAILLGGWYLNYLVLAPNDFPVGKQVKIESGLRVYEIANLLEEKKVIHSAWLFTILSRYSGDASKLQAGIYEFAEPLSVFAVMNKIAVGDTVSEVVRITFPEGLTVEEYATALESVLINFSRTDFLEQVSEKEGFLFPDTYEFAVGATESEVLSILEAAYVDKVQSYRKAIYSHQLSEYEIITLASILEREANSKESMRTVSGILQNRMSIGMALQADATVGYVLDKPLSELTAADLEIDSPYNTYLYPGLPPTPIGNPGLMAIEAVLNPNETDYFYYITGNDGNFYYATTFDEHRENIRQHLQ